MAEGHTIETYGPHNSRAAAPPSRLADSFVLQAAVNPLLTGDHCSDAILYPLRYRQPMEYITHVGSDGRKLEQPPNKTGSRTQNSVQPSQGTKRKPSQQRTAAVNTAGYKCVDKGES